MPASTDEGGTRSCAQEACTRSKSFSSWVLHFGDHSFTDCKQHDWLKHSKKGATGIWHAIFSNGKQQNSPQNQPCGLHASSMMFLRNTQDTVETCKSLWKSTSVLNSNINITSYKQRDILCGGYCLGHSHLAFSSWRGVRTKLCTEEGRVLPWLLIPIS